MRHLDTTQGADSDGLKLIFRWVGMETDKPKTFRKTFIISCVVYYAAVYAFVSVCTLDSASPLAPASV